MPSSLADPQLRALLEDLHARSDAQAPGAGDYFRSRAEAGRTDFSGFDAGDHAYFADKLVALDRDKAQFCYELCRATGARRIVECGASFGVSTLYLAAAVRDNGGGIVVTTEHEPAKAAAARANYAAAGLADLIDLREGDLRQTLQDLEGPIDFVLFDIWTEMVRPAVGLIAPHLRDGSVLCADNTAGPRGRSAYADYFAFVEDPANGLRTLTLPFDGGLEMTVRSG
ncbi:MAG TPA: class I SAM-dependent methyltransferase [Caulobacteraceae bacterium]|jgi:predicted O-methyltransferase YrrM